MSPQAVAAIIAANVSGLTLIDTLAAQYSAADRSQLSNANYTEGGHPAGMGEKRPPGQALIRPAGL